MKSPYNSQKQMCVYYEYIKVRGSLTVFSLLKKDLMVQQQVQRAFDVDALVSSHPLSSREDEVITPDQIDQLFDTITYSKVFIMCQNNLK